MIQRREFITLIGGAAATWPMAARGQQPAMPVVGVLYGVSAAQWSERMAAFHRGLNEAGFVQGRNVAIEYRWAEGDLDRVPAMAADLIARRVSVIATGGSVGAIKIVIQATKMIPVVFTTGSDPVEAGLVLSLNRPGGNVTGATNINRSLDQKRLELLHELVPAAKKIALLVDPHSPASELTETREVSAAARQLGLDIVVLRGSTEKEVDDAFSRAVAIHADAFYVGTGAIYTSRCEQISALGLRHSIPVAFASREGASAGALISYSTDATDVYRQSGVYVGRILKGEKPADLPVVQPTKFQLVVNLKTAKRLGLTASEAFLLRADEVIE